MAKGADLRHENLIKVKSCFFQKTILTKGKIGEMVGLSHGAVTNIVQKLLGVNFILPVANAPSTGGRQSKQYVLNPDYAHILMITIKKEPEQTRILARNTQTTGGLIATWNYGTSTKTREVIMASIGEMIRNDFQIKVVAISIPGVTFQGKVTICDCEELLDWPLVETIERRFRVKVIVTNDVNGACLGFYQNYASSPAVALLYQPKVKYVGCGMVLNHQLYQGATSFAGELSYLPFVDFASQEKMLRTNPKELLKIQLISLCSVINPEIVGICSDNFTGIPKWDLAGHLPVDHLPKLVEAGDFYELVFKGLLSLACDYFRLNEC